MGDCEVTREAFHVKRTSLDFNFKILPEKIIFNLLNSFVDRVVSTRAILTSEK